MWSRRAFENAGFVVLWFVWVAGYFVISERSLDGWWLVPLTAGVLAAALMLDGRRLLAAWKRWRG